MFLGTLLLTGACRERAKAPPPPPPPAASVDAAALAGEKNAEKPVAEAYASDGDAYFAVIEPHFQRVSIYAGPAKYLAEYAATPERPRNLLTAHWCAAEISNGGFMHLFSSSAGVVAPEALVGLRAMGLGESAAVVEEAMKVFGANYPREHRARHKAVTAYKRRQKVDNPFAELDERFFASLKRHPGGFDAVAAAYARRPS